MASEQPYFLEALNSQGNGVRVAFQSSGDRYSQILYGIDSDSADPILASANDIDIAGWPVSPPWQEIRQSKDRFGNEMLMLVGAAAKGHWSAAVMQRPLDDGAPYLEFDVAVRLQATPAHLGFAYQTAEEATWASFPGGLAFAVRKPHSIAILSPFNTNPDLPTFANILEVSTPSEQPHCRVFRPTLSVPKSFPATLRWRYWIGGPFTTFSHFRPGNGN